jgi:hypothetical protein
MKFTTLNQPTYKDDNGNVIDASKVEYIAPYTYVVDGFYHWECGQCGDKHSSRSCGWPISGQVLKCQKCGHMNLLVKTNIDELNQWMGKNIALETLDKEIKQKQDHLNQYVMRSELEALVKGYEEFIKAQQKFQIVLSNCGDVIRK